MFQQVTRVDMNWQLAQAGCLPSVTHALELSKFPQYSEILLLAMGVGGGAITTKTESHSNSLK